MSAGIRLVLPRGRANSRLGRFVGVSLVAHVIGTLALALLPQLRPATTISERAWAVQLVADVPAPKARAATAPAARTPAETTPVEPEPKPVRTRPEPARRVDVERPTRRTQTVPTPAPSPATDPGDATPSDAPAPGAPAGQSGPVGAGDDSASVTALEVADFRYAWYRDAVTQALYGNWRKPVLAGSVGPREVRVAFEIGRDGSVARLRVETGSGLPTLDRSALRAVTDAAPFPPLPGGWSSSSLPAAFVFRLFPD